MNQLAGRLWGMAGDVTALCAIAGFYLVLAFVLLKASVRRFGVSD